MSARGPVILGLAVVLGGAVVASEARDETPTVPSGGAGPGVQMPALPADDVLASTWYCAAGTAREGGIADHVVVVFNPGDAPVNGTVTVYGGAVAPPPAAPEDEAEPDEDEPAESEEGEGGEDTAEEGEEPGTTGRDPSVAAPWEGDGAEDDATIEEAIRVPARGRTAVRLGDLTDTTLASALVEADGPVAVEHELSGRYGRDAGPCASAAAPDWHLAWGVTTRGARELLVVFNPFPSPTTVDVEFATDDGLRQPVRYQGLPVPAGGVIGLDVGEDVAREGQVAATVRARSGSIVVERIQAFGGSAEPYGPGLAVALGAPEALESWAFAEGRVGRGDEATDRREWIVVYNPTDERAVVDVAVRPAIAEGAEPPPPFGLTVRPHRYEVVDYVEDERVPAGAGHATVVRSRNGVPVVAERVQAWPGTAASQGDVTATTGAAFADRSWLFAGAGGGEATRFVAYNPDPRRPAAVTVRGAVGGEMVTPAELRAIEVPPGGRREVALEGVVADPDGAFVVDADRPVVVERLVQGSGRTVQSLGPGILGGWDTVPLVDVDFGA